MASSTWNIKVGTVVDTSDIQSQLSKQKFSVNVGVSGGSGVKSLGSDMEQTMLTFQAANMIFSKSVDIIKSMAEQTIEVDSALTEFKKVSDLSGKSLENYASNLAKAGQTVARTKAEMIEAATEFKKSGYSDEDSATLATVASMFQNVSDTEITASEAASSIISQMKAFGIEASNATRVIDVYNAVANNFAVGTNDLSGAMEVAGASMATYGNSFEESTALVTAGAEIMQGKSLQVARGLNTIAARIVNNSDVLSEYGIEVEDANGNLKSTYEILKELSPQWETMGDSERVALGQTLAGTNQYKVLASVLSNMSSGVEAYETALDASGSASEENAKYMESLESKITALKAAFQDMSTEIVNSDLVGGVLDIVTKIAQFGSTDLGSTISQIALLTGTLWGGSQLMNAMNILPVITSQFSNFGNVIAYTAGGAGTLVESMGVFGGLAGNLLPIILGAVAGFTALYKIGDALITTYDEQSEKVDELSQAYEQNYGTGSEYAQLQDKIAQGTATQTDLNRASYLQTQKDNDELNLQNANLEKWGMLLDKYGTEQSFWSMDEDGILQATDSITIAELTVNKMTAAFNSLNEQLESGSISSSEYSAGISEITNQYSDLYDDIEWAMEQGYEIPEYMMEIYNTYTELVQAGTQTLQEAIDEVSNSASGTLKVWSSTYREQVASMFDESTIEAFKTAFEELGLDASSSISDIAKSMGISEDAARALITAWGEFDDKIYMSKEDMNTFIDAVNEQLGEKGADSLTDVAYAIEAVTGEMDPDVVGNYLQALADTGAVDASLEEIQSTVNELKANAADVEIDLDNTKALDAVSQIQRALSSLYIPTLTVTTTGITGNASGTSNAKEGLSFVNEEGAEIIQSGNKAYIANNGDPAIVNLHDGDKVFTANETKGILGGYDTEAISQLINGGIQAHWQGTLSHVDTGTIGSGSKSTKSSSSYDYTVNTGVDFDTWLAKRKHELAMDLITEEQYYYELEQMYKKHFAQGTEDYWKYEEEIYKYRKQQQEDELELEEKLNDVYKAKAERTKVWANGQWQYVSNIDSTASALQAYREAGGDMSSIGGDSIVLPNNNMAFASNGNIGSTTSNTFNIGDLTLPNVGNAEEFFNGLKNYALQYSSSRA